MKDNKSKLVKFPEITDHAGYSAALEKLNKLDSDSAEAERLCRSADVRLNRKRGDLGRYLRRAGNSIPYGDDGLFSNLAAKVISTDGVSPDIIAEVRSAMPTIPSTFDSEEIQLLSETVDTLVTKELLKRAILLQKREVLRQKQLAVESICTGLRSEREKIASALANAILVFGAALRDELALSERLRAQDASLPASLSPKPFPVTSRPSDPEVVEWVAEVLKLSVEEAEHLLKVGGESHREIS